MDKSVDSAQKLLEAFREIESDLPESAYKALVGPLEELCESSMGRIPLEVQSALRKRLNRLLEDNTQLITLDGEYISWLESHVRMNRNVAASHGLAIVDELDIDDMEDDDGEPVPAAPITAATDTWRVAREQLLHTMELNRARGVLQRTALRDTARTILPIY